MTHKVIQNNVANNSLKFSTVIYFTRYYEFRHVFCVVTKLAVTFLRLALTEQCES